MDKHTMLAIDKIYDEARGIKTFHFKYPLSAKPGQFVIVWIPGMDEKPFGVSGQGENEFAITVCDRGPFSHIMHELKPGNKIGIRGPYGNPFTLQGENIALVAGGYGSAPLAFLASELLLSGKKIHFIIGSRTAEILPFTRCFTDSAAHMIFCTDDGSFGHKGFVTDALNILLTQEKIDMIYSCGPEIMMKQVLDISREQNIQCEMSLERYMKCGFGVCGQCSVDPTGWRVCCEGPVFSKEKILQIEEFGVYHRAPSGRRIPL